MQKTPAIAPKETAVAESLACMRAGVKASHKCPAISSEGHDDSGDELICLNGPLASFLPAKAESADARPSEPKKEQTPKDEKVKERAEVDKDVGCDHDSVDFDHDVDLNPTESEPEPAVADEPASVAASSVEAPIVAEGATCKAAAPRRSRSNVPSCKPTTAPTKPKCVLKSRSRSVGGGRPSFRSNDIINNLTII